MLPDLREPSVPGSSLVPHAVRFNRSKAEQEGATMRPFLDSMRIQHSMLRVLSWRVP